jgi:hypothetical protein
MAASGQAATRNSPRNTTAANDKDLIKRAEAILGKSILNTASTSFSGKSKKDFETILEELIERVKQPPSMATNTATTSATPTERIIQAKKSGIDQATQTDEPVLTVSQSDIKAIDKKQDFIINLLQREKTYAEALTGPRPANQQRQQTPAATERLIKARKDLAQYEISITTSDAARAVQEMIQSATHKNIINALQEAIDNANLEGKPQLEEVAKLKRGIIRMRAATKEGAKAIKEAKIDWDKAYAGIKIYKPRYGIVVHGVPVWSINLEPGYEGKNEYKETIAEWQNENAGRNEVTIVDVKPLSRKPRSEYNRKKHQSIIIFTDNAEAADRCISNKFLIDKQSFETEKYCPHLQLKQCYKCHGFGHTAHNCGKSERCGKCADDHPTAECTSDERRCVNCRGAHEAWHAKCPTRSAAGDRAQDEQERQSPFFCT